MKYEMQGKVVHVGKTEEFGASNFRKRIIVLSDGDEKYEQQVPFEFTQDNTKKLDGYNVGDVAKITFNLRGREHNGKYYGSNSGWMIEKEGEPAGTQAPPQDEEPDGIPW